MQARNKIAAAVAAAAALAVGAYWYWSPYLTLHAMRSAAETRDADAFNRHVDYEGVRGSLKGQFSAMLAEQMAAPAGSELERAGAAFGAMLGTALADRMVEALVRPEVVMRAMQEAQLEPPREAGAAPVKKSPEWTFERKGADMLIARPAQESAGGFGLVFRRHGFADWKLSEIRMPAARH